MTATDIITITLLILGLVSASGIYVGIRIDKPAITFVSTLVSYFATSLLVFILLVTLGTVVVADTLV